MKRKIRNDIMKNYRLHFMIALCSSMLLVSGCSHMPFTKKHDDAYKSAKEGSPLEVPPDLTKPAANDRYSVPEAPSGGSVAATATVLPMAQPIQESEPPEAVHAKLSEQDNDILLDIPVDHAWRRVGLALDKAGFTVDDQDRVKGIYFVSYVDPKKKREDKGFLSSLEFWKDKAKAEPQKYQIQVRQSGAGSAVSVLDRDGFHEHTETSARILELLYEQLK